MAQNNVFNSTRIDTLNKTNYDTWRIKVQAILVKNDAWAYVSGEAVESTVAETDPQTTATHNRWVKGDRKAKSNIILTMSPDQLKHLRGCTISKHVWDKLASVYASQGPASKATHLNFSSPRGCKKVTMFETT